MEFQAFIVRPIWRMLLVHILHCSNYIPLKGRYFMLNKAFYQFWSSSAGFSEEYLECQGRLLLCFASSINITMSTSPFQADHAIQWITFIERFQHNKPPRIGYHEWFDLELQKTIFKQAWSNKNPSRDYFTTGRSELAWSQLVKQWKWISAKSRTDIPEDCRIRVYRRDVKGQLYEGIW